MTSGRQKRQLLDVRRLAKRAISLMTRSQQDRDPPPDSSVIVNKTALAPSNSYGEPEFVTRGYYVDQTFACACCGAEETWRATQQKWWYEVAKGPVYSMAKYCLRCRRKRREGHWRPEDDRAERNRRQETS